jgi:hypothetical protein
MTNLGDIYNQLFIRLGKDAFGGAVPIYKFNNAIDYVNLDKLNDTLKFLGENQNVQEDLRPFSVTIGDGDSPPLPVTPSQTYGEATLPDDFVRYNTSRNIVYVNGACTDSGIKVGYVNMLDNTDFHYRLSTSLKQPTIKRPIATIEIDKLLVAPKSITAVTLTYYRYPKTPFFDYNLSDAGLPVYLPPNEVHDGSRPDIAAGTPSSSVEFEWFVDTWVDIIERLYRYFAVNIKSVQDLQMSKPFEP